MSVFTKRYVGGAGGITVEVAASDGFNAVSVQNESGSASSVQVKGTREKNSTGEASEDMNIEAGLGWSDFRQDANPIVLTITVPALCFVNFSGS